MDNSIVLHFVRLTIFSLMFAVGINHSFEQLTSLWRRPAFLTRSLLAVIVVVPVLVVFLLWLFDLPIAVVTGLAVLAAAPGAPLTYKRTQMARGDPNYSASLQLTLALLAVVSSVPGICLSCSEPSPHHSFSNSANHSPAPGTGITAVLSSMPPYPYLYITHKKCGCMPWSCH